MVDLIDPFHRNLYKVLSEDISDRVEQLVTGSAKKYSDGAESVAEKYAAQISYLQALRTVLEKCREIEVDMYGSRQTKPGED